MILRDVPRDQLQILWSTGMVYWKGFQIMWASRKKFTVKQVGKGKNKSFVLWDVIGYFQSSFVVACEKWLGDLDVLKDIQEMKLKRSEFKSEDIESIVEYNKKECILLVLLMDRLFASLDEAEVELKRYDGAGSIAAALLLKNNVVVESKRLSVVLRQSKLQFINTILTPPIPTPVLVYRVMLAQHG